MSAEKRRIAPRPGSMNQRQREWLECHRARARSLGGACLSSEYRHAHVKLRWRCAEGHEWDATANSVRRGTWCPACYDATHLVGGKAFTHVKTIARARGGRCLSTRYGNAKTHLRWRCAEGHEWEAVPGSISSGTWCPRCAGMVLTIDDMHEFARARGGLCLATEYVNSRTPMRWRCAEGHEWETKPSNISAGAWCSHCAGVARKTIADVQAMVAERGGVCLSTTIKSVFDPLRFRCRVGHVFKSTTHRVRQGGWCKRCRYVPPGTLERLQRAVERRGGVLLADAYHGSSTAVRVRCQEGHEWSTSPTCLISGRWCRECWLASSRGRPVHQRLSIVEMQEVAASRGGRCLSEFYVNIGTKLRWLCHNGHEWDAMPKAIRGGAWCPRCAHLHRGTIDGMRALAVERGGKCRSRAYQNHNDQLRFTCARGHDFPATGMAVKSGAWCPTCGEWDAPAPERVRRRVRSGMHG